MNPAPCATCPWRKTSTVGGGDIPNFSIEKMRALANTVGDDDAFRPVMACHYSTEETEFTCNGYAAKEGQTNLALRVMAAQGRIDIISIREACATLDLWPSFAEMLEAYEEANQ